jgi:hypothetical protein
VLTGRPASPNVTDLTDSHLTAIVIGAVAAASIGLVLSPSLPEGMGRPGSPLLQSAAILGSILLVASFVSVLLKKIGYPGKAGFRAHVWLASAGTVLVIVHSTGSVAKTPSLLLLSLAGLVALGVWSRLAGSKRMARTFGSKLAGFSKPNEATRAQLAELITHKQSLLSTIDPGALEAVFSLKPRHWITAPGAALGYHRAVMEEHRLIGTRASVSLAQAYWRPLHRLLAWGFVAGLLIHVVTVTVFAGYVANGRAIYWWRIAEWGS